jgi:hypothetical protein
MKIAIAGMLMLFVTHGFWIESGFAADKVVEKPVVADTPDKFAQTEQEIRSEMEAGGRYEFIKPRDKAQVEVDLNSMRATLQTAGSVAALNEKQRIQLFNTQEHLNGLLTHSDSNRMVCERRAPVGSNIPINMCKTVGEIEKDRRDSQKYMMDTESHSWGARNGGG